MANETHRITALQLQKRNRQRVNVYLDGEFAFGLARIVAAWLSVGQEISDAKIAELKAEDGREVAYQRALNLLNYRPRSVDEVRKKLETAGIEPQTIEYVVERLRGSGLLDDKRFAKSWIENRTELRPRSRRALAFELRQRGLDSETIDHTLAEIDDEALAYQAAQKQARKLRAADWPTFRQKMYAFLARRGFNYEVSEPAVSRVWAEIQGDGAGEQHSGWDDLDSPMDESDNEGNS